MTKKTRSIILLAVSLSITLLAMVMLLPEAAVSFAAMLFAGGLGSGVAIGIMMVPQPTRISRASRTAPKKNDRPTSRRRSSETARSSGNGGDGPSRRKKSATKPKPKAKASSGPRVKGTVKWFSDRKGFGFITPESGEEDCFVHRSSLKDGTVAEGKLVEFQIIDDDKGRRAAADVTVL